MNNHKLVIIGLDGADWRVLQPKIDAGLLPNLAKLQSEGSYGRLHSTIRPESSVAWSTFATGVNPGKHGIFGFVHHQPNSYNFTLADSSHIPVYRFWDHLGAEGKRVGLVNIPFTYPPQQVNGFLVAGMLTPGTHVPFTYPPELQERLLNQFDPFLFDASEGNLNKTTIFHRVQAFTKQQAQVAKWLLKEESWDFFTVVFTGLDRLQHFLWDESEHHIYLHQLDKAIGEIVYNLSSETIVMLISDHGFNGVGSRFYINKWLQDEGYLELKTSQPSLPKLGKWLARLKKIPIVTWLKRKWLPTNWGPTHLKTLGFGRPINWVKTQVYYAPDGGLRINLKGREPFGTVSESAYKSLCQELTNKLLTLRDSRYGKGPIAHIYPREEIYKGKYINQAPDLIVEPMRDASMPNSNYLIDSRLGRNLDVFTSANPYNGNHASTGILLAWRPGVIAQKKLSDSYLQDIAPTVLAAFNVPIPKNMDGTVLQGLFIPTYCPVPTFVSEKPYNMLKRREQPLKNDDTVVEERLRNLGYLD